MTTTKNRRGRPAVTSCAEIEAGAMKLFRTKGYTATTLSDIASEVGCSRTSIYRYWGGKPDIVWAEFDRHNERLADGLAEASDRPPLAAVRAIVVRTLDESIQASGVWMDRYLLIRSTPELRAGEAERWSIWAGHVERFLVGTGIRPERRHVAASLGAAFQATFVSVLDQWSERNPADPVLLDELDRTLQDVEDHLTPWLTAST